jgi:multidrug resistance efflux pump
MAAAVIAGGTTSASRKAPTVRERQVIITIPDTTRMAVEAKIHEAYVKLVDKGQKVRVRADANRDRLLDRRGHQDRRACRTPRTAG